MVNNDQQQEKPQDFELIELLFGKVDSSTSDAADSLDKSFEARYQSLVDQIQSYLHSSEKPGFFPHRFLGSFSSVLDTKLNDKLAIKKLHFRFEGARTLKVVAETESKTHVFIFTEDIEAQHSKPSDAHNRSFEFTKGEFKSVIGRDYTELDARKLQIDVIKILKDKYELVKSKPKSDKDVKSRKLHSYLKRDGVLENKAKNVYGNVKTIEISRDQLKGKVFDEVKQFLGKQGKDLSDDARKELSRMTSEKGYTLKSDGEDEKINIKVESKKKIKDIPISPPTEFPFIEVKKKLGKSIYLESYIEKLANPDKKQVQDNFKAILNYIKKVHTNLNLQGNVYGMKAREADQHGFVAGVFDNFRYRDNTKVYLEQFAGGGYADIVLLVRGPDRAIDSVPILIELKAGTEGQVDPSDALEQAIESESEEIEFRILESKGKALLDREIMETFLSAVHERPQAQEIAKNLVNTYAGVGRILGREMDDLKVIEGVADSAVAMIICVKETLERVLREKLKVEPIMNLQGLVEYLNVSIGHSERECVKILYLNKRRRLIGEESYIGEMEKAPVYIKEIIKKALIKNATLIIMSHNHPGGSLEPSEEDQAVTKSLAAACSTVSVKLFDHIIITSGGYFSFRENGLL